MAAHRNLMALDVGERRIGLAIANSSNRLSRPLKTIVNNDGATTEISRIISSEPISILVVGLPRNLNGEDTAQTNFVRSFADELGSKIEIPVFFEDEALSSVRAKESLKQRKKPYDKAEIDSQAACYILDDFMANQKKVIDV